MRALAIRVSLHLTLAALALALLPATAAASGVPASRCPDATMQLGGPPGTVVGPDLIQRAQDAAKCVINEERRRFGAKPFVLDPRLQSAAQARAEDLAANQYIGHKSPSTGRTVEDEMRDFGWPATTPLIANENFAIGADTPRAAAFSPFFDNYHCNGVLNGKDTQLGFGVAMGKPMDASDPRDQYPYWVYLSGRPAGDPTPRGSTKPGAGCPYYKFTKTGQPIRLTKKESAKIRRKECPKLLPGQGQCTRAERKGR